MIIKTEIDDLADFEAWSEAVHTKNQIVSNQLGVDFMTALEDNYPDGMTETELNDLLWFEEEWCYKLVGLNSHGVVPADASDVADYLTSEIDELMCDFNHENGTDFTADELGISESDFVNSIESWLEENQEDETDEETLAELWLEDCGRDEIRELIRDEAPNIPEADDHKHGDYDE